jgi:phosphocarrier protein HPr
MPEIQLHITNKVGLHARPASLFVQEANKYESEVIVINGDNVADGKSILDILLLGADQGCVITVRAEGSDAEDALFAFQQLQAKNFGETE